MDQTELNKAAQLIKSGQKQEAQMILTTILKAEPTNSTAWYGLSLCISDIEKKKKCLQRVLELNPDHKNAKTALDRIIASEMNSLIKEKIQPEPLKNDVPVIAENQKPSIETVKLEKVEKPERKKAGESTFKMADQRRRTGLLIGFGLLAVYALLMLVVLPNASTWRIGGTGLTVIVILVIISPRVIDFATAKKAKEMRRAVKGAKAEVKIGALLAQLDEDFEVINDINGDYGNIDHLVIHKSGAIFMIETKSHNGKISFVGNQLKLNGHDTEKDFIAQSLRNSYWLRDHIELIIGEKPWVNAILVFTNACVPFAKPVKGVMVTNKKFLIDTIKNKLSNKSKNSMIWESREKIIESILN